MDSGRKDYRTVSLTPWQQAGAMAGGAAVGMAVILLFYRQWIMMAAAGAAGAVLGPRLMKSTKLEKQRTQLSQEFREALYDLTVSLRSGKSLEGAVLACAEETDSILMPLLEKEWKQMAGQVKMGIPVETCLKDLGERSGIEEIRSFARSVEVCKRSEGNVAAVMENTIRMLQDRMELRAELRVLIAEKRMESRVMTVMPFVIVGMLLVMSPDYLSPLYTSVRGYLIMAVCTVLCVISVLLSRKMVQIDL